MAVIRRAMLLAAGRGSRLSPLTDTTPKPLLPLDGDGVCCLDYVLCRLKEAGVESAVVNAHHLAGRLEAYVRDCSILPLRLSLEAEVLETGGGVRHALSFFGTEPFYVVNGDILWWDKKGGEGALRRLAANWRPCHMDSLLLLTRAERGGGGGDFDCHRDGRLRRRRRGGSASYLFAGVQVLDYRPFVSMSAGAFSLNVIFDRAMAKGRLHGVVHDGGWMHVSTLADLERARRHLSMREVGCGNGRGAA